VALTDKGEETKEISSKVETQLRRSDISGSKKQYEPLQVPADDVRENALRGHLDLYYDQVISFIGDAESILIFGPGEAKRELKKRLEKNGVDGRVADIETADRLTDAQIAATVREYFLKENTAIV